MGPHLFEEAIREVGVAWVDEDRSISLDQITIAVILVGVFPEITEEPFSELHDSTLPFFNKRIGGDVSNGPLSDEGTQSSTELDLLRPRGAPCKYYCTWKNA